MTLELDSTSSDFNLGKEISVPESGKTSRLVFVSTMETSGRRGRRRSWPPEADSKEPAAGIFVPLDLDLSEAILSSASNVNRSRPVSRNSSASGKRSSSRNKRTGISFDVDENCCSSSSATRLLEKCRCGSLISSASEPRNVEAGVASSPLQARIVQVVEHFLWISFL